ncbi:MAG TPA: L,D-transpeptidase family protein [Planctomycetota bacterium]|nr:L,D-transpeptidase family protein [Planctomycetota bacterium]
MSQKRNTVGVVVILCLLIAAAAGYAVVRKRASLSTVSRLVPAQQPQAEAAAKPAASESARAETPAAAPAPAPLTVMAKPVEIKKSSAPVIITDTTAAVRQPLVFIAPGPTRASELNAVKKALSSGKPQVALEALRALPALSGEDAQDALVLEARALLAMGQIEEARKKFEPLAFASPETERGADALFGNYLCQAGLIQRCRDTELEQVLAGAPSWGAATAAMEEARRAEEKAGGDLAQLEKARRLYQLAFDTGRLEDNVEAQCLSRLMDLTNKIVLDPKTPCTAPKAVFHKVEPGDSVEKIAKKYRVNQGQIKLINRLNDRLVVRVGQTLKMLPGDVLFRVDRTELTGTLYIDGIFIRHYPVGIGPGNATPCGTYTIERKAVNPDWYYDGKKIPFGDPANILGTRWMAFAGTDKDGAGLGIHGTSLPESVPGRESKGCVRMINSDVEELYDLMPQGGKAEILD